MKRILSLVLLFVACLFVNVPAQASTQSDYVDTQTRRIISELNIQEADTYHKVLAINDYIYDHFEFTRTYTPDSAYSLLKTGGSNCQGFAQLFIELTKKVGIESAMVYQDYMDHRWNVVKMDDGKYYFVDTAAERQLGMKHKGFLKGTNNFYYKMNSTFKYEVSATDYIYTEKPVEVKPEVKPTETKPVETPTTEQKPVSEQTTEEKPQTKPTNTGNNSLGLFIYSNTVKLDFSKVASAMFSAWKKR